MESIDRNEGRPLVSVITTVYNHEKFLPDYFRGILMQKTSFPFEVIIHDDASTDNSAEIIKEYVKKYPDIFKPIFQKSNQWSQNEHIYKKFLYPKVQGKYIALCEGDDYWSDSMKLQKEVDILEEFKDYGFVYTDFHEIDKYGNRIHRIHDKYHKDYESGDLFIKLLSHNFPLTCTVMYRSELFDRFFLTLEYDYTWFLYLSGKTKFYYLDEDTSCYRIHPGSVTQSGLFVKYEKTQIRDLNLIFNLYLNSVLPKRDFKSHVKICYKVVEHYLGKSFRKSSRKEFKQLLNSHKYLYIFIIPAFLDLSFKKMNFSLKNNH